MKILIASKFYYRRGGDCTYALNLESLLRSKGHETAVFAMQYPLNLNCSQEKYFPSEVNFNSAKGAFKATIRALGMGETADKFKSLIDDFQPHIVHLNNIHSQLSPVIAEIAHRRGVKVVWTLHDYKLVCPRYDCLLKGNTLCERCFTDKKQVLKNRCMKNSLAASAIAYLEALKWNKTRIEASTDTFICPSRFMYNKMTQAGYKAEKLVNLPNFLDLPNEPAVIEDRDDYCCYLGRLSPEKGVETLIEAANQINCNLKIIGEGPLKSQLEQQAKNNPNIEFTGFKQWNEIKNIVSKARFIVVPSEWYENFPISIIESLCLGTPALGARIGGIPEMITEGENGLLFESRNANDLKNKIESMLNHNFDHHSIANKYREIYSSENHYNTLMHIYGFSDEKLI